MSWYNNTDNSFIDATQTYEGASGNISGGDGTGTGGNSQLSDVLELKLDYFKNEYEETNPSLVYNLYLKNNNEGGEIRFLTKDAVNNNDVSNNALKYNVKIGNDGKLYLYYTYNPLISALIFSGWIDVVDYIIQNSQGNINNATLIATIEGQIISINSSLNVLSTNIVAITVTVTDIETLQIQHEIRIQKLEARLTIYEYDDTVEQTIINARQGRSEVFGELAEDLLSRNLSYTSIRNLKILYNLGGINSLRPIIDFAFNLAGIGGTIAIIIAIASKIADDLSKEEELENLKLALDMKARIRDSTDTAPYVQNKIYLGGLQIDQTTNNNFTTAGDYEVDIIKDGRLKINIAGSPLIATITDVISIGDLFTTSDIIYVNKSDIGGTIGQLTINITSLKSLDESIDDIIYNNLDNIDNIDNRQRRRQFIPDKNDFGSGLEVTETDITEPYFGDITKKLNISLKIDPAQFYYDATGNLQLSNYSQIATNTADIITNSGNITSIQGDITTIQNDITTIEGNITTIQSDITTIQSDITTIQGNITDVSTIQSDIVTIQGDITTIEGNITTIQGDITTIQEDISNLQGNNDVLSLLLPPNQDGTFPTINDNVTINNGLLHIGYKGVVLNENYGDYFILYIMPYFSITTDITINNIYLIKELIGNKTPLLYGAQIQNDNQEYTSSLVGYIQYSNIILSSDWYFSLYLKNVTSNFESIYSYNNIEVLINTTQIKVIYQKYIVIEYHYLDNVFTDGLQQDTTTYFDRSVVRFTNTNSIYNQHQLLFFADNPNRTITQYQSIFNNDTNYQYGFEILPFLSTTGGYFIYSTGNRFPNFQNWVFNISRNWTAGSGFQGAIEVYIRITVYGSYGEPFSFIDFNHIYSSPPINLGQQQYQSINNNIVLDTLNTTGYNWWLVEYVYTNSNGIAVPDYNDKTLMFGKIKHQLVEYGQQLVSLNMINSHNMTFNTNYKHLVINDRVASQNQITYYDDGVLKGTVNIPSDRQLINNNNFTFGGLYNYRSIGIGNGVINTTIINEISQLSKNNYKINIPDLSVMEQVYITDKLILENQIQFKNQDGTSYNNYLETYTINGVNRRRLGVQEQGTLLSTFNYTDEIFFRTPPSENQFLFYNTSLSRVEGINTSEYYTKSDIDTFNFRDYNQLINTPDLSVYQLISSAFSGNYNDLTNKPTLFSGSYTDLTNTPDLSVYQLSSTAFSGNYNDLTNKPTLFSGSYTDLTNTPDLSVYQLISSAFSGNYNDLTNKPTLFSGSYTDLTNKPDLSVYQLISSAFSGDYNDLINKPTLFSGSYLDLTNTPDLTAYITETELDSRNYITLADIPPTDLSSITVVQENEIRVDYDKLRKPITITGGETVTHTLSSMTGIQITDYPDHVLIRADASIITYPGLTLTLSANSICDFIVVGQNSGGEYNNIELSGNVILRGGDVDIFANGTYYQAYTLKPVTFSITQETFSGTEKVILFRYNKTSPIVINESTGYLKYDDVSSSWIIDDIPIVVQDVIKVNNDLQINYTDSTSTTISILDNTLIKNIVISGSYLNYTQLDNTVISRALPFIENSVDTLFSFFENTTFTRNGANKIDLLETGANIADFNQSQFELSGGLVSIKTSILGDSIYWVDATPDSGIKYDGTIRPTDINTNTIYSTLIRNDGGDLHTDQIIFSDSTVLNTMPLTFNASGSVGIGVTPTTYKLEVNGIIKGSSSLYLGSVSEYSYGYIRVARNDGVGGGRSMLIHYDDNFNMCISDYGASYPVITTPFKINYLAPANSLYIDDLGCLNIKNIRFEDSSEMKSNKLYLCKLAYSIDVATTNIAVANTWVIPSNQFNTTFLLNPSGFTLGTNGVVVPVDGYYEITINNYFNNITIDRGSMISALAINGSYSSEDYICGSYVRFDSGMRGSRGNSGSIIRYLTMGTQISTAWYEIGDSSQVFLGVAGSSFTVKKLD